MYLLFYTFFWHKVESEFDLGGTVEILNLLRLSLDKSVPTTFLDSCY